MRGHKETLWQKRNILCAIIYVVIPTRMNSRFILKLKFYVRCQYLKYLLILKAWFSVVFFKAFNALRNSSKTNLHKIPFFILIIH